MLIHSRALLAAILSQLTALRRRHVASALRCLELVTMLDYS